MFQHNVTVPHEYFTKSKLEYQNWRFAFFRELIQNSVDAKSTEIQFFIEQDENTLYIRCVDNGKGMDKNILVNKLLCLGGSHKEEGSVGGFGYAKTLLFFAHKNYTIQTKNFRVEGSGGSYNLFETENFIKGTDIFVSIPRNEYLDSKRHFERVLKEFLELSNFKTKVFLNNEKLKKGHNSFDFSFETPIGELKFSDADEHQSYSELWVRVNGIPMFSQTVGDYDVKSHFNAVIELNLKSTDVLTSNRDSLKNSAKSEFNKIFSSLQNERSALKSENFEEIVLNPKMIEQQPENFEVIDEQYSSSNFSSNSTLKEKNANSNGEKNIDKPTFSPFKKIKTENEKFIAKLQNIVKNIHNDSYPKNFHISLSNSNLTYAQIKNELNKKRSAKLANDWITIVSSVLYSLSSAEFNIKHENGQFYFCNKPIHFGFCFSNNNLASNASNNESYRILLNPVKVIEKLNSMRNRKLIDLAIHEVTHLFQESHNENFCSTENNIKWIFYENQNIGDINIKKLNN